MVKLENYWSRRPQEDTTTDEDPSTEDDTNETEVEEKMPFKKKGKGNKPLKICIINALFHFFY